MKAKKAIKVSKKKKAAGITVKTFIKAAGFGTHNHSRNVQ